MEPFYRNILKKAWAISWKNKWLWVMGFFAGLLGNASFYETVIRSFGNLADGRSIYYTLREYSNMSIFGTLTWPKILELWNDDSRYLLATLFFLLVVVILLTIGLIFAIVSQVGIIKSTIAINKKKKFSWREAIRLGLANFWPVLGLNFVTRVVMFGLLLLFAFLVSLLATKLAWLNILVYSLAFVILLILGIIIYFITIYGTAFIALRNHPVGTALRYSWYLFKQNILLNLEMGFILFVIGILSGVLAIFAGLFALSPFILLYLLLIFLSVNINFWILGTLIVVLLTAIVVAVSAWYVTFQISVWSLLFEELVLDRGESKFLRVVKHAHHRLTSKKRRPAGRKKL